MDAATATRDYPSGDLLVSDAERDRAVGELSQAFQAGRITAAEFDQRSGQVLRARTGNELTAQLADLPPDRARPARSTTPGRAHCMLPTRITIAASAITAISLAAVASANAAGSSSNSSSLDPSQRLQLAREVLARQGLSLPRGFRPPGPPGFDWVGTITPGAIAVVLVVLIIVLILARRGRPGPQRSRPRI